MAATLWAELRPMYLQLHAYVRRRLKERYGDDVIGTDGTLPAHLLGESLYITAEHLLGESLYIAVGTSAG